MVLLAGSAATPAVVERRDVQLSDPSVPASRQPYHAATGVAQTDAATLAHLTALVERCASQSVAAAVSHYRSAGYHLLGAGVVVGSNIAPDRITNPHIRAHASEGQLFRRALEEALRHTGLVCTVVVERTLYTAFASLAGDTPASFKQAVAALGRGRVTPWRAEDKAAAAVAWIALAQSRAAA